MGIGMQGPSGQGAHRDWIQTCPINELLQKDSLSVLIPTHPRPTVLSQMSIEISCDDDRTIPLKRGDHTLQVRQILSE
ncbi:hypothetical protein GBAR_LOCUS11628 [Geodia barretti]|uniref:Uncharacterized protein n=1 Tax=Geodia barretti TaxID=519541 RepID=A0AA35WJE5_GEOBA|nr:hypothetical protein GBAR_LOCUS11628 [Geodia barretti]